MTAGTTVYDLAPALIPLAFGIGLFLTVFYSRSGREVRAERRRRAAAAAGGGGSERIPVPIDTRLALLRAEHAALAEALDRLQREAAEESR